MSTWTHNLPTLAACAMAALASLATLPTGAQSEGGEAPISRAEAESFAQPSERAQEQVRELIDQGVDKPSQSARKQARGVVEDSRDSMSESLSENFDLDMDAPGGAPGDESGPQVVLYASSSLELGEMREAVVALEALEGVRARVVYRGLREGEQISDFSARVYEILSKDRVDDVPIELDPVAFSERDLDAVPRIEYQSEDGEVIASVDGLSNAAWLNERVEQGERGYLGVRGPLEEIEEPNLIDVLKARLADYDFDAAKERTIETFWDRASLAELPPAREDSTRRIDPSVAIPEPMTNLAGEVIHEAGTVINPLELRPFTRRLLIIDPTREAEIEWLRQREETSLKDILMITDIDRSAGWEGYVETQDKVGLSAYLLTPDVRQRFKVRATPTVITAEQRRFVVKEIELEDQPKGSPQAQRQPGVSE